MGRTSEQPIPVEETYRDILRVAVAAVGGQERAAELARVHQATISRTLSRSASATYTTLCKLASALPGVPHPVVPVRDADHARWCKLGAALQEMKPEEFRSLLTFAELACGGARPTDDQLERLRSVVANPLPSRLARKKKNGR